MKRGSIAARTGLPKGGARAGKIACFDLIFLGDLLSGLLSQASSPDYRRLSLIVLGYYAIPTLLVAFYFYIFRDKLRWVGLGLHGLAGLFILEMILRVWVGGEAGRS